MADLVNQFAHIGNHKGRPVRSTGGLSDLEHAFRTMGIPDPCPDAEWRGRLAAYEAGVTYEEWLAAQAVDEVRK